MLTKAVVDDDDDDDDNSSDEEKEKESRSSGAGIGVPTRAYEFSKFIPEKAQKPKVAGTNSEDANAHEKKKKKEQIRAAKRRNLCRIRTKRCVAGRGGVLQ